MGAIACLFVLGGLMIAIVAFFWAAGSTRKQAEDEQDAADTIVPILPLPSNTSDLGCAAFKTVLFGFLNGQAGSSFMWLWHTQCSIGSRQDLWWDTNGGPARTRVRIRKPKPVE